MMNESDYNLGLFGTPFCHRKIQNWKEKKSQLLKLKVKKHFKHVKEENIITDFPFSNENNYSQKIEEILKEELDSIYMCLGVENYFIRNSWIEVANKNMDHLVHNHGGLGLSAIVYLDYNPKYHSPTGFVSPINFFDTGMSSLYFPDNIDDGSLVVFPSAINHFSKRNDSDIPRTILSFNMVNKQYM
tara:strand:- start:2315 stop:2875 length:561 start_codon:yes stop_codon:yes gene_type:complete